MEKSDHVKFRVKVQVIYFQTRDEELGKVYATSPKRITISESEQILEEREIGFDEVLKTKYEDRDIEIPLDEFENYIIL